MKTWRVMSTDGTEYQVGTWKDGVYTPGTFEDAKRELEGLNEPGAYLVTTPELLTDHEHAVLLQLASAMVTFTQHIVGNGNTRNYDISEFAVGIHKLQHMIMAQAAARAYPETYRLLGESLL